MNGGQYIYGNNIVVYTIPHYCKKTYGPTGHANNNKVRLSRPAGGVSGVWSETGIQQKSLTHSIVVDTLHVLCKFMAHYRFLLYRSHEFWEQPWNGRPHQ